MGGLKLTFKLGPKKPAGEGAPGSGASGSAPEKAKAKRALPSGPTEGAPHPFASGARTGGGAGGEVGPGASDGARPKVPMALLRAKLERERAAAGSPGASADGPVMRGVPKALAMKGVPKALQQGQPAASSQMSGGGGALGVASGKVEKKKVKRPISAHVATLPGGAKVKLISGSAGLGAASAARAAKAALDAGYDSWGEGDAEDDRASGGSAMAKKRKRGGFGEDARDADPGTPGGSAQTPSRPPSAPPTFAEPPPKQRDMLEVVKKLQSKDKHGIFAEPVTEAIAPGYFGVVDRPMDFRTLRDNVGLGKYQTWDGFAGDLELIYANAAAYNPPGTAVHVLANKTADAARKIIEKARHSALSPAAKRARMASVNSFASIQASGGAGGAAVPEASAGGSLSLKPALPGESMGGTGTGGAGLDDDDDDDEVAGGHGGDKADEKKKAKIFKRHTFAETRTRFPLPSMAAHAALHRAGSSSSRATATPQAMVHATAVFHQPRELAAAYAGSLRAWAGDLTGRARCVAERLASRVAAAIPAPPPKPPKPPPKPPSPERYDPLDEGPDATGAPSGSRTLLDPEGDASDGDDDVSLVTLAAKVRGTSGRGTNAGREFAGPSAASAPTPVAVDPAHTLAAVAAAAGRRAAAEARAAAETIASARFGGGGGGGERKIAEGAGRGAADDAARDPLARARAYLGVGPNAALVDIVRGTSERLARDVQTLREEVRAGAPGGAEAAAAIVAPPFILRRGGAP